MGQSKILMKKHIYTLLLSILLLSLAGKGMSQSSMPAVGVRAGLNLADIIGRDVAGLQLKLAYHAGLYARFEMQNKWYFQPEILLNVKGAYSGSFGSAGVGSVTYTLYYLDLPLLFSYGLNQNNYFSIGAQPGLFLTDKQRWKQNSRITNYSGTGNYNPVDVALVGGYNYEANNGLNAGFRINYGMLNVIKNLGTGLNHSHNLVIQLTVGYTFLKGNQ